MLAFTLHETGANLLELHPLRPWRRLEQAHDPCFIDDWGATQFRSLAQELAATGYYVFASERARREWKGCRRRPAPPVWRLGIADQLRGRVVIGNSETKPH